ncbi:MAG: UDP-2,3-diacylglucosamine diphosphatase [Bacteroidota bacterium]|nr:UDP-2,3-diacylglucosamine diphosphatase [Bacteroidota bacterium]
MKNIFFVSDIHLGLHDKVREKEKERHFLAFLEQVERSGEQLFIVGDLFDYWFEYKYVIPRGYHHVISKLGMLVEHGVKVSYIAGNHDFWLGDFFPNDLGIPVYKDPLSVILRGKRFYLHHGDGLALNDAGYRILKKILRSRLNIFLFSLVHPGITAPVAKGSSRSSREYTSQKDYGETDGMILCAEKKIAEGCDVVIMGHRHQPTVHDIGKGRYINLGDWITYRTYAEFDGTTTELKHWEQT